MLIRGIAGSIKIDLGGLGIDLIPGADAVSMPDDSLCQLGIRSGDIAIVQPPTRKLRKGDILAVEFAEGATLRRLIKRGEIWYLEAADGKNKDLIPFHEQPFQGVVVGILRLFSVCSPVRYKMPDSAYAGFPERGCFAKSGTTDPVRSRYLRAKCCPPNRKRERPFSSLMNEKSDEPNRLTERLGQPYGTSVKTRKRC